MANRYGGITGSKKISEDFNNINIAFDKVQAEMDTNKQVVDTHTANADIHTTAAEKTKLAGIATGAGKDGSATDTVIGNRTISDAEAPNGDTGTPTKLWGWLAYMVKAITGKSSWRTAPATTLEAAKAHADNADIHITKAEHTKLTEIQEGAQVNQFAFAAINTIMATSPSDTVTFENGTGISITYNPATKKITWTATGESTPGAHGGSHDPDGSDPIPALIEIIDAFNAHKTDPNAHPYYAKADDLATLAASLANKANTTYVDTQVSNVDGKVTSLKSDVTAHLADYVRQPAYAQTTGTATAYTVTLDPAPASIPGGFGITIVPHVDCGANPTLKIGSLAAVALKDQKGNAYASGKLLAGKPYTFRKVGTDFLADSGSGGGGNLQPNQALAGFTFTNDSGEQIGVGDGNLLPENIRSGVEIFRVSGNLVPFLSPGDTVMFSKGSTASGANTTPVKKKEIGISGSSGKIRIKFGIYTNVSSTIAFGQIYINGVAVGIQRSTSSTTAVVFSEDMYVASGDLIQLYIWHSNGTANTYTPTFDLCHNYPVSFS